MPFPAVAAGISGILSGLKGLFGGGSKKKTKAALAQLNQAVITLSDENKKQSKIIMYLAIGLGVVVLIVLFFVVLKKRRK